MKTYDIFYHRTYGTFAIKRGFSWPAFIFGPLWALRKGHYTTFYALVALYLGLELLYLLNPPALPVLLCILGLGNFLTAQDANGRRRHIMRAAKCRELGTVMASSQPIALGRVARELRFDIHDPRSMPPEASREDDTPQEQGDDYDNVE